MKKISIRIKAEMNKRPGKGSVFIERPRLLEDEAMVKSLCFSLEEWFGVGDRKWLVCWSIAVHRDRHGVHDGKVWCSRYRRGVRVWLYL